MKLVELLYDCELVYVDEDGEILEEATVRQYKRVGQELRQQYRCTAGIKKGKLVSDPSSCSRRKDPKKVRLGRKVMRSKKGTIVRKSIIAKRGSKSKLVTRINQRLMGTKSLPNETSRDSS